MTETKEKQTTLTGGQVVSEKIHLGGTEEKHSGRFNYLSTQVLYDTKTIYSQRKRQNEDFFIQQKILFSRVVN